MVVVTRTGSGPEVLLVHGGASPASTWRGLEPLAGRWTLAFLHRRGFPPSPPPRGRGQDFAEDAEDLVPLLGDRPHLVGHSYGGVVAMLATAEVPDRVRSLTLVEPGVALVPGRGSERLVEMARIVAEDGADADPATLREFLGVAGAHVPPDGPLPDATQAALRRARGMRSPFDADLPLLRLRESSVPVLVASGAHHGPIERNMDALAAALDAHRLVAPGAGHFVAAAPGFAARLDEFLRSAA